MAVDYLGTPPDGWFKYKFPLPRVQNAPIPSVANYKPQNIAWLIELMADVVGQDKTSLVFRYENNTPDNPNDDILAKHPNDGLYLPAKRKPQEKSPEQLKYEQYAKQSPRLKLFEKLSPARIKYFQDPTQ